MWGMLRDKFSLNHLIGTVFCYDLLIVLIIEEGIELFELVVGSDKISAIVTKDDSR